jgi:WD repeat and SOF domain-containing protein 1
MDIDYSPTGQEIVTGSYDRTIRLYDVGKGHSRDCYHTKRMQRYMMNEYGIWQYM